MAREHRFDNRMIEIASKGPVEPAHTASSVIATQSAVFATWNVAVGTSSSICLLAPLATESAAAFCVSGPHVATSKIRRIQVRMLTLALDFDDQTIPQPAIPLAARQRDQWLVGCIAQPAAEAVLPSFVFIVAIKGRSGNMNCSRMERRVRSPCPTSLASPSRNVPKTRSIRISELA